MLEKGETLMKAAVVTAAGEAPRFADFPDPTATDPTAPEAAATGPATRIVTVSAAGLHPVVKALASGEHYGSGGGYPMIPGIDGTGRLADGSRVYFGGSRPPYGTMAEYAPAPAGFCVPLPDGIDDVTAAAIMNPGLAAWLALKRRAVLAPGETVLVLGATGVSGQLAVQLAGRLGAGRVIAAGRNQAILDRLDASATVRLGGPDDARALSAAAGDGNIDVIVDYLWGAPTEAAIRAVTRRGLTHTARPVRLVEVGQSAGATITLPADVLRSSGLHILGSGAGSVPIPDIVAAVPEFLRLAAGSALRIEVHEVPLSGVEAAWHLPANGRRVVIRPR
jgi:NADPH2:quinone reductase